MKSIIRKMVVAMPIFALAAFAEESVQTRLENLLRYGFWQSDCLEDRPAVVPYRYRDSLPQFERFLGKTGWTTNQLVEGLFCAITNNVKDENWADNGKRYIAMEAAVKMREIDMPVVTNFFRQFNDSDNTVRLKGITIPAMFLRTNLEPEVLAYVRSLCVRTNVYCIAEYRVVSEMFHTLKTMPEELKPAATNRVAKYIFFAIRHETDTQGWHDRELARFIPAYSNSFQRLSLMRYVAGSTTNVYQRKHAVSVVQRLEAMPTNQLNNISWIAEDVNNGGH